jgi:glycosyltransferase involved in cell wall biosynthesis
MTFNNNLRPKVLIAVNTAWNLFNFRANLIRALVAAGYEVVVTAPPDAAYTGKITDLGCRFVPLPMRNHGTALVSELALCRQFWRLLQAERPQAYLGYTVKPNTYGSALAALRGVTVVNNISGLGSALIGGGWLAWVVRQWYWLGLRRSDRVFFQNASDSELFVDSGLVCPARASVLPGSGVDLQRFAPPAARAEAGEPLRFLLVGRVLRDKGVVEYVDAARSLRSRYPQARFQLLGAVDEGNRNGIQRKELQRWVDEGTVDYLGTTDDVRPHLAQADCVVLPSYREGTSRALLEAAAMACPLIATDVPGCREALDDGVSGLLCRVKDAPDLAARMAQLIEMPPAARAAMGAAGRLKMEREFDEAIVINAYLAELVRLGVHASPRGTRDDAGSVTRPAAL